MSIAQAERLKAELTDKYVIVAEGVPELRRFVGLTGTVKTVNMSCRALVQFNGPVDISWYDIDPSYLQVVDAPVKKEKPAAHAAPAAPAKAAPGKGAPAAAAKPAGQSPLDAIRAKGAGGAAPAPTGEKKASPLDMIRAGGAKKEAAAPAPPTPSQAEPPVAEVPPAAPVEAAAPSAAPAAKPKSTADILASIRKKS